VRASGRQDVDELEAVAKKNRIKAQRTILDVLGSPGQSRGAFFFRQLASDGSDISGREETFKTALWELIWGGWVSGDTFAPVRALLTGGTRPGGRRPGSTAHRHRRAPRLSRYSVAHAQVRPTDPTVAGRWAALPAREPDSTLRAHFTAELLMNRYGVLTRNAVASNGVEVPGGFAMLYKVLTALEEAGRCQRGYFVESLGGAQFASAATVDRLRGFADNVDGERPVYHTVVLAAADPANPYGAALPWPVRPDAETGHRPGRKAGALVVLVDGELVWFLERGGRSLLTFGTDPENQRAAAGALADMVRTGQLAGIVVEKVDGTAVLLAAGVTTDALTAAGFARTPRGLRMR
jgi:ATP-dependent Lhr-like helicase